MTTGRFCPQCGRDAAGAVFCPYCGASQAVETPSAETPATATASGSFCIRCGRDTEGAVFCPYCGASQAAETPNVAPTAPATPQWAAAPVSSSSFCPNCGAQVAAGLAFCNRCGANMETGAPLAPSQSPRPAMVEQSKTPIYVGAAAVVAALVIAFVIMSGGGEEPKAATGASTNVSTGNVQPGATAKPAAAQDVAVLPKPVPLDHRGSPADDLLGPLDSKTVDAVTKAMNAAKVDMKGTQVFVYPVYGTQTSLLVFDVDGNMASSSSSSSQEQMIKALAGIPELKTASVDRVVMNYKGKDKQGNYLLTVTMTLKAMDAMSKGTLSQADMQKELLGEVKRLP